MNIENNIIANVVDLLECGSTLLYPTDTIWGIGCDATNADAVEKIYMLKQRDHSKSMLILCKDIEMVEHYVAPVSDAIRDLLVGSERPTTVIMPLQHNAIASNLAASDGTIGVRIPHMDFCQSLLSHFGKPIVSTSANLSGQPSPMSYDDISVEIRNAVDYCVPREYEASTGKTASKIVKLLPDGDIAILRE